MLILIFVVYNICIFLYIIVECFNENLRGRDALTKEKNGFLYKYVACINCCLCSLFREDIVKYHSAFCL